MTSASFDAARQRVNDPYGILELLEIAHPSFSSPAYIVNDTQDWDINGTVYVGYPFRLKLPQDVAKESPKAQIEIDNTGRELTADLEALPPNSTLDCTMRIADRSNPTVFEYEFRMPMTNVSINAAVITATLSVDPMMRRQAVLLIHDPVTSPGIFQD